MQQLAKETIDSVSASDCAEQLLEVTPFIMRRIRAEMRRRTMPGMTMPQFRVLGYLRRHPRASLNDVAEHLGMTAPSASKLVQRLVAERIVARRVGADRRRVCLSLTQNGISALAAARAETRENMANNMKTLSQEELAAVSAALTILGEAFTQGGGNVDIR